MIFTSDFGCDRLNVSGDNRVLEPYVHAVDNAMDRKAFPEGFYVIPCARGLRSTTSGGFYHIWSECDWGNVLGSFQTGDCQRINGEWTRLLFSSGPYVDTT